MQLFLLNRLSSIIVKSFFEAQEEKLVRIYNWNLVEIIEFLSIKKFSIGFSFLSTMETSDKKKNTFDYMLDYIYEIFFLILKRN